MDAFESIIAMLLQREGYWVYPRFKVQLTKEEKRRIGRPSAPRWELDIIAYQGAENKVLIVECKSYIDSTGVFFQDGTLRPPTNYKLFTEPVLREVVFHRLREQLVESNACPPKPTIQLALATGKIANKTDRVAMNDYFENNNWILLDDKWVQEKLTGLQDTAYENDIAYVAAKLALRKT
jgi:hypothetical protein